MMTAPRFIGQCATRDRLHLGLPDFAKRPSLLNVPALKAAICNRPTVIEMFFRKCAIAFWSAVKSERRCDGKGNLRMRTHRLPLRMFIDWPPNLELFLVD
jgi:hypothetical protein